MRHWWFAVAASVIGAAAGAQASAGTADITIASRTPNAVKVQERFMLGPSSASIHLRVMTRPCMVIENMRIERNGVVLADTGTRYGPWITWRDTTSPVGDSVRLAVSYDVWLGGSRTIPLVHLTEPLARSGSPVTVAMRFAHDSGDVEFPHMTRQAPNEWSGRYIATPAFVKIGGFAFACDRKPPAGDDGGLVWRYWLLLGIMVTWVPIYLMWARRTGERA